MTWEVRGHNVMQFLHERALGFFLKGVLAEGFQQNRQGPGSVGLPVVGIVYGKKEKS